MRLFHLHRKVKIRPLSPIFRWRPPRLAHFIGYPFGTSKKRLCLSLWLIQDSNWKGRALWRLSGGLATILQDWISCNEQKMREAHITRRETSFYLFMIFIEKISNRKLKHSQRKKHQPPFPLTPPKEKPRSWNGANLFRNKRYFASSIQISPGPLRCPAI